jgi:hypothetical protein
LEVQGSARQNDDPFRLNLIAWMPTMIPLQLFDPASSTYTYILHDPPRAMR